MLTLSFRMEIWFSIMHLWIRKFIVEYHELKFIINSSKHKKRRRKIVLIRWRKYGNACRVTLLTMDNHCKIAISSKWTHKPWMNYRDMYNFQVNDFWVNWYRWFHLSELNYSFERTEKGKKCDFLKIHVRSPQLNDAERNVNCILSQGINCFSINFYCLKTFHPLRVARIKTGHQKMNEKKIYKNE